MIGLSILFLGTRLDWAADFHPTAAFREDKENFTVIDAAIGWRAPKRYGVLSFQVRNLLREDFSFQELNFYNAVTNNPRLIPDRVYLFTMTINL